MFIFCYFSRQFHVFFLTMSKNSSSQRYSPIKIRNHNLQLTTLVATSSVRSHNYPYYEYSELKKTLADDERLQLYIGARRTKLTPISHKMFKNYVQNAYITSW